MMIYLIKTAFNFISVPDGLQAGLIILKPMKDEGSNSPVTTGHKDDGFYKFTSSGQKENGFYKFDPIG